MSKKYLLLAFVLIFTITSNNIGFGAEESVTECTNITTAGAYNMTNSISNSANEQCYNVRQQNVSFFGNGFIVDGTSTDSSYGINASQNNFSIRDVKITDWAWGIEYRNSANGIINNVTVVSSNGITLQSGSTGNVIKNSNVSANSGKGIEIFAASNIIANNTISNNTLDGISTNTGPSNMIISNNLILGNLRRGISLSSGASSRINNNIIMLSQATGSNNGIGIDIGSSSTNQLINNTILSNRIGLRVNSGSGNVVWNSTIGGSAIWDILSINTPTFTLYNVSINTNFAISGVVDSVNIRNASAPTADPANYINIHNRYVNMTNTTGSASIIINISYNDADIPVSYNERNLTIAKYNGTTWTFLNSIVENVTNQVSATITDFKGNGTDGTGTIFALMAVHTDCTNITAIGSYAMDNFISNAANKQCYSIQQQNVSFDGNGFIIDGTGSANSYGINATQNNFSIKNVKITDWFEGIEYRNASNGLISDVTIAATLSKGIYFSHSSTGNNVRNSNVSANFGIGIQTDSSSNIISNNTLQGNGQDGIAIDAGPSGTIVDSNLISGNRRGIIISSGGSGTIKNNIITNHTAVGANYGLGIDMSSSATNSLINNTIQSNRIGIRFQGGSGNIIWNSTIDGNAIWDIYAKSSDYILKNVTINKNFAISATATDVAIRNASAPAADAVDYVNVSNRYVNITNASGSASIILNISYNDADIPTGYNESNLTIGKYNGTTWTFLNSIVENVTNQVSATITDFKGNGTDGTGTIFALMASPDELDTTAPTIDYAIPTETDESNLANNYVRINITAADAALAGITIRLYNTTDLINTSTSTSSPFFISLIDLADGLYAFNATATDASGNTNSTASRTVIVDTLPPAINYVSPAEIDNTNLPRRFILINVTSIDANLNNITIYIFNETSLINETTTTSSPNYINIIVPRDGNYTFNATAIDISGNTNSTASRTLTIDATSPTIQYAAPTETAGTNISRNSIAINVTSSDANLANITINLFDSTGLKNSTTTTSTNLYLNFTNLADGAYQFNATATDTSNNQNSTATRTITIDTTPPAISMISPQNMSYNSKTQLVNISTADAADVWFNDGAANNTYADSVYVAFAEGSNTLIAYANDTIGNINTASVTFSTDTTPPTISYAASTENDAANLTKRVITINVVSADTNLKTITIYVFNIAGLVNETTTTTSPNFVNITVPEDGQYIFNATSTDTVNNQNNLASRAIFVDTVIPPNIQFVAPTPANNTNLAENNFSINTTATDANMINVTIYLFNSTDVINTSTTTSSPFFLNYAELPDGNYAFNATVLDKSGNTNNTDTRFFMIDTRAPTITYVIPTETDETNISRNSIIVNVTAIDTNLANITIRLWNETDSNISETTSTTSPNFVNITVPSDGTYFFNATATDTLGNRDDTNTRTVMIDATAPSVQFVAPTPANNSILDTDRLIIKIAVTETNFANITVNLLNSTHDVINTTTQINYNNSLEWTLTNGIYYYNATAIDLFGNKKSTDLRRIQIDVPAARPPSDGGGGGGGGAGANQASTFFDVVSAGQILFLDINKGVAITNLEVEAKAAATAVKFTVEMDFKPSHIPAPSNTLYKYAEIRAENLPESAISSATIRFEVDKKWLAENSIDANTIVMQRYAGIWQEIPTTKLSESTDKVMYSARSPGFSYFAITGKKSEKSTALAEQTPEKTAQTGAENEITGAAIGAMRSNWSAIWKVVVLTLFIVLITFWTFRKKSKLETSLTNTHRKSESEPNNEPPSIPKI